jgi:hypothetical protein
MFRMSCVLACALCDGHVGTPYLTTEQLGSLQILHHNTNTSVATELHTELFTYGNISTQSNCDNSFH